MSYIPAVLPDGRGLRCNQCLGRNQYTCLNPTSVPCHNSTCATISELSSFPDKDFPTYYQSCLNLPVAACNTRMRLSVTGYMKLRVTFNCCNNKNNCNRAQYEWQEEDVPSNSYQCPVCYHENSTEPCDAGVNMMNCTENEFECVTFIGTLKRGDDSVRQLSFRGCIIKDGCKSGFAGLYGTTNVGNYTLTCKDAKKVEISI
ncbi:hypothetical protein NDU88_011015 [Pleurodeles waltl]|uniref:Sodefrin-like factor n=2 Tax=Pleurodeles waltl TaxID=8319 RepID=A0AAV7PZH3_PLEWA|nr:hypothetical protein NDU88_011015 [Pleurodeles waltl]